MHFKLQYDEVGNKNKAIHAIHIAQPVQLYTPSATTNNNNNLLPFHREMTIIVPPRSIQYYAGPER